MREIAADDLRILMKDEAAFLPDDNLFGQEAAADALRFHRSLLGYAETRLVPLSETARALGLGAIYVKDESTRFGLNAFKALGGSYAMFRILCERLGLDYRTVDFRDFQSPELQERCSRITFATATDGNHGKGVSWAASLFGCQARVFMPAGSVEARRRAIETAGNATAEITAFNYDGAVAHAAALAHEREWILLQDTAWEGYETYPRWIVEGYLTLASEAVAQLGDQRPTHVFLQAGVGAMSGGVAAYLLERYRGAPPFVAIVEPGTVACVYGSAQAGDGRMHSIGGNPYTIMAGLNCGTPCAVTWPVLRDGASAYLACADVIAEQGMRAYAHPMGADKPIISGESGAVTYGAVRSAAGNTRLREALGLDGDSVVLLVNTEGDTDPDGYRRIVYGE